VAQVTSMQPTLAKNVLALLPCAEVDLDLATLFGDDLPVWLDLATSVR